MAKVARISKAFNVFPLGPWADEYHRRSIPRAVRKIARHYRLPFATALTTAALAGYPVEARNDR